MTDRSYAACWAAHFAMPGDHLADPSRDDLGGVGFDTRSAALRGDSAPLADAAGLP